MAGVPDIIVIALAFLGDSWTRLTSRATASVSVTHKIPSKSDINVEFAVAKGDFKILALPTELVFVISSFLDPASTLALSLMMKSLHGLLFQDTVALLQRNEKLTFLRLLENDFPDFLLCHICTKLYDWRFRYDPRLPTWPHYNCPRRLRIDHGYLTNLCHYHEPLKVTRLFHYHGQLKLTQELRDLILRAHTKGNEDGLPLSALEHDCRRNPYDQTLDTRKSFLPRIVNGNLMLRREYSATIPLDSPQGTSASQFDNLYLQICKHSAGSLGAIIHCAIAHATAQPKQNQWDGKHKCQGTLYCSYCATDLRVRVRGPDRDGSLHLSLTSWQDFGDRDTPIDSAEGAHFTPPGKSAAYCPDEAPRRDLEARFNSSSDDRSSSLPVMARARATLALQGLLGGGTNRDEEERHDMRLWYRFEGRFYTMPDLPF